MSLIEFARLKEENERERVFLSQMIGYEKEKGYFIRAKNSQHLFIRL